VSRALSFLSLDVLKSSAGSTWRAMAILATILRPCVKRAFFELAQVAPTDLRLIRKLVLRQAFGMTQAAQIGGQTPLAGPCEKPSQLFKIYTSIY